MKPRLLHSYCAGVLLILLMCLAQQSAAQHLNYRLQRDIMLQVEKAIVKDTQWVHLGDRPIPMNKVNPDRMGLYGTDTAEYYYTFTDLLLSKHLVHIRKKDFEVMIDPLFNFQFGDDFGDSLRTEREQSIRTNTRGFLIQGNITDKVSFMTSFYENQAVFPMYVRQFVGERNVVPGMGRVKPFGEIGHDFAMATGYVVVAPTDFVRIQYGHDKNFVGHGYRSLLLSDNTLNYPHLRITWSAWKNRIQYTSVFGKIHSLRRMPMGETREPNFAPKGFSYNYLSVMPWRFLEIGFYEAFVWRMYDVETETRTPFIGSTINPFIFTNSAGYGLDDTNNGVVGMNLRLQPTSYLQFYGQVMLDDPNTDKYGYQVGFKIFDALIPNLDLQAEYNRVTPFTYGASNPLHSYTHNNEFLAHPWGAGFREWVGIVNYRWRRVLAEARLFWGDYELDYRINPNQPATTNLGKNPLRPETLRDDDRPGNPAKHIAQDFRLSYVVNPSYNMMINAGVTNRWVESPQMRSTTTFVYIGIRTYIDNQYFDF